MIDPATRTTPVRIVTQNTDGLLKKDLFVDVDDPRQDDARGAGRADRRRALRRAELSVRLRAGRAGQVRAAAGEARRPAAATRPQILDGLKEGDRVVSQGSVFLQFANSLPGLAAAMINRLVSFALSQRFIVIVAMIGLAIWGVVSFQNLPIDAYPGPGAAAGADRQRSGRATPPRKSSG